MVKYSQEFIKETFAKLDCTWIRTEHETLIHQEGKSKGKPYTMKFEIFKCNKHPEVGEQRICFHKLMTCSIKKCPCSKCMDEIRAQMRRNVVTDEKIIAKLEKLGYTYVRSYFKDAHRTKNQKEERWIVFICNKHPELGEQETRWDGIDRSNVCKACSHEHRTKLARQKVSEDRMRKEVTDAGLIFINTYFVKLDRGINRRMFSFICPKHAEAGVQVASWDDFVGGCRCPICGGHMRRTTDQFINELAKISPDIEVLGEYVNQATPITVQCKRCGHVWEASPIGLLKGTGCFVCNKMSRGERTIHNFLESRKEYHIHEYFYEDLQDVHPLRYDFYLPQYNLLIEFQGEQHAKPNAKFGGQKVFERQQKHDQMKREYAKNHNINLLEIWYYDFKNISDILEKELEKLKGGSTNDL